MKARNNWQSFKIIILRFFLPVFVVSSGFAYSQENWQSLNEKVNNYNQQGRYDVAIEFCLKALDAAEKEYGKSTTPYAVSQNTLGLLYAQLEQYLKAEPLYVESAATFKKVLGEGHSVYGQAMQNLGQLYVSTFRYKEAEDALKLTLMVYDQNFGENSQQVGIAKYNLAKLYFQMNKYSEAETYFIDAIFIYREVFGQGDMNYITAIFELASLYKVKKEFTKAEPIYKEIIEIYKQLYGENSTDYAHALNNYGTAKDFLGQYDVAEQFFLRALKIYEEFYGTTHQYYVKTTQNLARVYDNKGDFEKAKELWLKTINEYLKQINNLFPALSEEEKGKFFSNISPYFEEFNSFAIKWYKKDPELLGIMYNNQLATKALLLNASSKVRKRILNSGDQQLIQKFQSWIEIKEKLSKFYSLSKERLEKSKIDLASYEKKANLIERELSKESEIFAKEFSKKAVAWDEVRKLLKEHEAAIEIVRYRHFSKSWTDSIFYTALIITKDSKLPIPVIIENGNELETDFLNCYKNMIRHILTDNDSYNAYWAKIDSELNENISKVYISLDGVYNQINLNTIRYPNNKYLIDNLDIQIVHNTKYLVDMVSEPNAPTSDYAELFGFPDFEYDKSKEKLAQIDNTGNTKEMMVLNLTEGKPWDSFKIAKAKQDIKKLEISELPGTETEIVEIYDILNSKNWKLSKSMRDKAREAYIKSLNNPRVLHIATHGYFLDDIESNPDSKVFGVNSKVALENPLLRSGLLFAGASLEIAGNLNSNMDDNDNGILTAFEAMNLDLDKTELVVLSACETGLGEVKNGEGVYGLQRAFEVAGAKTVMMSLWTVNDYTTRELMTKFYEEWIATGDKRKAFISAQLYMKEKYTWPFYWGPFVMVGE